MTVEEFIGWARAQPGRRYELENGRIIEMPSESVGHVEIKYNVFFALKAAAKAKGGECHALGDGVLVRIDPKRAYEPDALIYCGEKLPLETLEIPSPVVVVEVLSPFSLIRDTSVKLANYFKVASIAHYLIVDPENQIVVHHWRGTQSPLMTQVIANGAIHLDPPGIDVAIADIFALN